MKPPPRLRRSPRVARRFVSLASSAKGARESRATLAGAPARRAPEAKRASRSRRGRAPRASSPRVASGGRPLARRTLTCLASLAETRDTRNRASSHLERVGAPHARLRGSPCAPGRARARPRRPRSDLCGTRPRTRASSPPRTRRRRTSSSTPPWFARNERRRPSETRPPPPPPRSPSSRSIPSDARLPRPKAPLVSPSARCRARVVYMSTTRWRPSRTPRCSRRSTTPPATPPPPRDSPRRFSTGFPAPAPGSATRSAAPRTPSPSLRLA